MYPNWEFWFENMPSGNPAYAANFNFLHLKFNLYFIVNGGWETTLKMLLLIYVHKLPCLRWHSVEILQKFYYHAFLCQPIRSMDNTIILCNHYDFYGLGLPTHVFLFHRLSCASNSNCWADAFSKNESLWNERVPWPPMYVPRYVPIFSFLFFLPRLVNLSLLFLLSLYSFQY
jgi:hypothetical protein